MFRKNTTHLQTSFFDIESQLSESKRKKIRESEEYNFYQLIFEKDKRGKLRSIVFRKGEPAKLSSKHNGISDYPCL